MFRAVLTSKLVLVATCAMFWASVGGTVLGQPAEEDVPRAVGPRFPDESGVGRRLDVGQDPEPPFEPEPPPGPGGRRGGRRFDRPPRPFFDRLLEEERERILDFVREYFPEEARELRHIWQSSPERFQALLRRMAPELIALMRSRERDPEDVFALRIRIHRNELKIRKAARRYFAAEENERRERLRARIRERIEENFNLHQQLTAKQIERLEARIARIHERLEQREEDREHIIENELERRLELSPEPREPRRIRRPPPGALPPEEPFE